MKLTPPYTSKIIEFQEENITTTSNYAIIKIKDKYTPELINFYLNSEYTKKQIYKYSEKTSTNIINISNIKDFQIKDIGNNKDKYTQLIKTFINKKRLLEKKLEIEENVIEELIFGE